MWTYLQTWIVQDGEVPELAVGDQLPDVGIQLQCDQITIVPGPNAEAISVPTPRDQYRHTFTGVITRPSGGVFSATVLQSAAGYFFLEPADPTFDSVAAGTSVGIDPIRIPQIPAGTVVSVSGTTNIIASHEVDGFASPLVADRVVRALALEYRTLIPVAGSRDTLRPDEVISVEKIDRMRRWHDDPTSARSHATYLLQLDIPPSAAANPSQ